MRTVFLLTCVLLALNYASATNSTATMTMFETSAAFATPPPSKPSNYTMADIVGASGCAAEKAVLECVQGAVGSDILAAVTNLQQCTTTQAQIMWAGIADCIATAGDEGCCSTSSYNAIKANWDWVNCTSPTCIAVGNEHIVYVTVTIAGTLAQFEAAKAQFVDRIAKLAQVSPKWVEILDVNEISNARRMSSRKLLATSVAVETAIKTPSADVANAVEGKLTNEAITTSMKEVGLTVTGVELMDDLAGAVSLVPSLVLALFAGAAASFLVWS